MKQESSFDIARLTLLTGAGFTKNFGGCLASEMWAMILNQPKIRNSKILRQRLLGDQNLDYEAVYDAVIKSGDFTKQERNNFSIAIDSAYGQLDKAIIDEIRTRHHHTNPLYRSFLRLFEGKDKKIGFVFTLNQDLLLERFLSIHKTVLPGLDLPPWVNTSDPLTTEEYIVLPAKGKIEDKKSTFLNTGDCPTFAYVKLHGSYGWKYEDRSNAMVLGLTKAENMEKEPFKWYLELFKSILDRPEQILVVAGYSFRDKHINKVIVNSLKNAQLKLHVISPKDPKDFRKELRNNNVVPLGEDIWNGLQGYHCAMLEEFFNPPSPQLTEKGKAFWKQVNPDTVL